MVASAKIGWYSVGIVGLATGSIWLLKSLVTNAGPQAWASVALGQAIGGVVAIVVGYGWGVTGPALIAHANSQAARTTYFAATAVRTTLFIPGVLTSLLIAHLLRSNDWELTFLGSLPITAGAFTASFYYVGRSIPKWFFLVETTPRLVGLAVAAVGLDWLDFSASLAVVAQSAGVMLGVVLSAIYILRAERGHVSFNRIGRRLLRTLSQQRHGMASLVATSLYSSAPVLIVSFLAGGQLAAYTVVDRLVRQVSIGVLPVTAVFQGWIPRAALPSDLMQRSRIALAITALIGLLMVAAAGATGRETILWLSSNKVKVTLFGALLGGAIIASAFVQNVLASAVMPALGKLPSAARAVGVGALVGVLALVVVSAAAPSLETILSSVLVGSLAQCFLLLVEARPFRRLQTP